MCSSIDPKWEEIHRNREWGKYPTKYVIRFVARNYYNFPIRQRVKILDYGCGGGSHTWYLAREGFDTYAFDGSQSAIQKVKLRMEREKLNVHLDMCDAMNLPYPPEFFDAVIDNFCVATNTTAEIKEMYKEIYRVLKPGGKLLTAQFGKNTDGYKTGICLDENTYSEIDNVQLYDVGKTHFTDKAEMKTILEQTGFMNINLDTILYTDRDVTIEQIIVRADKPKEK